MVLFRSHYTGRHFTAAPATWRKKRSKCWGGGWKKIKIKSITAEWIPANPIIDKAAKPRGKQGKSEGNQVWGAKARRKPSTIWQSAKVMSCETLEMILKTQKRLLLLTRSWPGLRREEHQYLMLGWNVKHLAWWNVDGVCKYGGNTYGKAGGWGATPCMVAASQRHRGD